ncbi:MAG: Spy/CpxP family protein refolding chaperone [Nitrospirales bacterium]
MKKRMFILGTAGVVILGAAFAFAASQGYSKECGSFGGGGMLSHWGKSHNPQQKMNLIAMALDLDEAQKEKLLIVKDSLRDAKKAFSQVRLQTMDEILGLMTSDTLSQDQLLQIVNRHQVMVNEVSPKVTTAIAEFHATLSSEQKSKAAEFVKTWKNRFDHWKDHQA